MTAPPTDMLLALVIATFTLTGIAFGKLPGIPLDRSGYALVGSALLLLTGVLDLPTAAHLLDVEVLALLFGVMLLNTAMADAGIFDALTRLAVRRARTPLGLLVAVVVSAGVGSALFLNDTIALMLTPLVIAITRHFGLSPLPYLLALATAANVGSVATITGNPQNMVVAVQSGIGYLAFAAALTPVAVLGLLLVVAVIAAAFPATITRGPLARTPLPAPSVARGPRGRLLWLALAMLLAFALGAPVAVVALVVGALVLLVSPRRSPSLLARVDYPLLVLFAGLMVVVGALRSSGFMLLLLTHVNVGDLGVLGWSAVALLVSTLVSNVPAVMLLAPTLEGARDALYLTLAMASTLAGNLTLIASVANLIVAESAAREGERVGFLAYLRVGVPITLGTLALGVLWLTLSGR